MPVNWLNRVVAAAITEQLWWLGFYDCFKNCPLFLVHMYSLPRNGYFARRAVYGFWGQDSIHNLFTEWTGDARHQIWIITSNSVMIDIAEAVTLGLLMFIFFFREL